MNLREILSGGVGDGGLCYYCNKGRDLNILF